jgi:low affinity Fe/Cu permease
VRRYQRARLTGQRIAVAFALLLVFIGVAVARLLDFGAGGATLAIADISIGVVICVLILAGVTKRQ